MTAPQPVRMRAPEADQARYQRCFGCGPDNPIGLGLVFNAVEDEPDHVFAIWTPKEDHQGWPQAVHGGLVSTLLDEAAAYVAYARGDRTATARLNIRFHTPAPVADALRVDGRLQRASRRLLQVRAQVTTLASGAIVADADATLMLLGDAQRREFGLAR
ncbi:MAG: PaaI family thioesterase [Chloroflexi bacterium]|nr:PaaI family thioesterase [Chloroflexota bacterium]